MASRISPYVDNTGLVFAYDLANVKRSYLGEPTVNLHPNPEDVSSWTGNLFNNWINSAVTSNASIAPDGTLTADRLGDGYGRFNTSVSITAGQTYTYSVYLKNVSLTNGFGIVYAWGLNGSLVSYGTAYNVSIAEISTGKWTRVTTTITAPGSGVNQVQFGPCPFTGYGNPSGQQLDVWGGHIENKSHATPYVNGTRSVTQGLKDLTGNSTIDLTNVSFDANAQMTFDGTGDYVDLSNGLANVDTTRLSVEMVFKSTSTDTSFRPLLGINSDQTNVGYICLGNFTGHWSNESLSCIFVNSSGTIFLSFAYTAGSSTLKDNQYHHIVFNFQTNNYEIFVDGEEVAVNTSFRNGSQSTSMISNLFNTIASPNVTVGYAGSTSNTFLGDIPITKIYNRVLTASEIQQNFNAIKGRYGL